jgi:hypothetical protein
MKVIIIDVSIPFGGRVSKIIVKNLGVTDLVFETKKGKLQVEITVSENCAHDSTDALVRFLTEVSYTLQLQHINQHTFIRFVVVLVLLLLLLILMLSSATAVLQISQTYAPSF